MKCKCGRELKGKGALRCRRCVIKERRYTPTFLSNVVSPWFDHGFTAYDAAPREHSPTPEVIDDDWRVRAYQVPSIPALIASGLICHSMAA